MPLPLIICNRHSSDAKYNKEYMSQYIITATKHIRYKNIFSNQVFFHKIYNIFVRFVELQVFKAIAESNMIHHTFVPFTFLALDLVPESFLIGSSKVPMNIIVPKRFKSI